MPGAPDRPQPSEGGPVGYSPITLQRKPIITKKPLNRAIKPRPPYGELAPSCGTSCRPTPNTTAHSRNSRPKNHLPFGPVIRRVQPDRPSATAPAFWKMTTNRIATAAEPNRIGRLLGKSWNHSVKIVTVGPC